MRTIIAIDPGKSGGVAVSVLGVADCRPMPRTPGDVLALLRCIKAGSDRSGAETVCVLEKVNGFVGKAQPGSAMFKFGEGYGFLMGVVQALGIKLVLVRPQDWQKEFGLGTASRCASQSEWKNKLKGEAQRRFPHLPVTHKTADALLILEWARGARANTAREDARPTKTISEVSSESPDTAGGSVAAPLTIALPENKATERTEQ